MSERAGLGQYSKDAFLAAYISTHRATREFLI
jgi:hypothetical protein